MLLKELSTGLTPALVMIFTKSMESGQVPADWMEANSTPIFKKGSKSSPGNYRTVSLTAVRCKVTESVVRDAVTAHLTSNKLIKASQHGLVKCESCVTNLLEYLEKATMYKGEALNIIYLDFA
jgi:bacterioferritin-associated ferredoxin